MKHNKYDYDKIKEIYETKFYRQDKAGNVKEKYLTTHEIAQKLGYGTNTFAKWVNRNVEISESREIVFKKDIKIDL
jgi:orotate phosphoribosyltransferase-like protein